MPAVRHNITLINMLDGSVDGHKAGCADIKKAKGSYGDRPWTFYVSSKNDAWLSYNSDFYAECPSHDKCDEEQGRCDNAYDIHWLPCANEVPEFDTTTNNSNTNNKEITMNTITTANLFDADITTAREALVALKVKGDRADMVNALLAADGADARDSVVESYAAGELRRGLRHFALVFEGRDDQTTADVFWALRDDIDEDDDTMFRVEVEAV